MSFQLFHIASTNTIVLPRFCHLQTVAADWCFCFESTVNPTFLKLFTNQMFLPKCRQQRIHDHLNPSKELMLTVFKWFSCFTWLTIWCKMMTCPKWPWKTVWSIETGKAVTRIKRLSGVRKTANFVTVLWQTQWFVSHHKQSSRIGTYETNDWLPSSFEWKSVMRVSALPPLLNRRSLKTGWRTDMMRVTASPVSIVLTCMPRLAHACIDVCTCTLLGEWKQTNKCQHAPFWHILSTCTPCQFLEQTFIDFADFASSLTPSVIVKHLCNFPLMNWTETCWAGVMDTRDVCLLCSMVTGGHAADSLGAPLSPLVGLWNWQFDKRAVSTDAQTLDLSCCGAGWWPSPWNLRCVAGHDLQHAQTWGCGADGWSPCREGLMIDRENWTDDWHDSQQFTGRMDWALWINEGSPSLSCVSEWGAQLRRLAAHHACVWFFPCVMFRALCDSKLQPAFILFAVVFVQRNDYAISPCWKEEEEHEACGQNETNTCCPCQRGMSVVICVASMWWTVTLELCAAALPAGSATSNLHLCWIEGCLSQKWCFCLHSQNCDIIVSSWLAKQKELCNKDNTTWDMCCWHTNNITTPCNGFTASWRQVICFFWIEGPLSHHANVKHWMSLSTEQHSDIQCHRNTFSDCQGSATWLADSANGCSCPLFDNFIKHLSLLAILFNFSDLKLKWSICLVCFPNALISSEPNWKVLTHLNFLVFAHFCTNESVIWEDNFLEQC